ncbi:MAG: CRISPR-associated protein Cas4 [Anaerolineae bacterium]|jgi:CRISPR-associated exonuclease Cas4|nr:CRISPR-associated protein Cas4 [Anaerolineae bacterium]MBT4312530.1 CRISPR-associated protein Cas4 [Anaerolineae bacterium]MBT4457653.1 CRISPR-associated protein Cas4 [Anaerolineae bacterium]MBT4841148.1 CRISPR-associated protein Cas4 [Anaerolineae bacterium]MBT6062339.1 CRISPR-associated protein Cas4 [Anaerolineae bacterium]
MTIYIFLILLLIAIFLFWQSNRQRRRTGLPGGRVIYTDTGQWGRVEKPLYDASMRLTGRPDYLVERNGKIIPIEVKSGKAPDAPYDSHIYQLASYCLLVHKTMGKRPPYGIIHYSNRDFAVDYTPALEAALLDILAEMRRDDRRKEVACSHSSASRCRGCGYRKICDQRLA